jgi:hypothetical protein
MTDITIGHVGKVETMGQIVAMSRLLGMIPSDATNSI